MERADSMKLRDRFGMTLGTGQVVEVPDPEILDPWSHSFQGTVHAIQTGRHVTVSDQDGCNFDVEPERLTILG